ncbi:hypothetical protein LEN26_017055 [Aphanomyces euteiches]|nr:hypothetical protein LEN26_017055 [Aphanomyces euteiches]KAH9111967.1 hypothetical protein AeMF1_013587 [Aphanomyces euteiches]KAH9181951.1 hypothetical protein AeNC1_016072 [Aphanomyces euteiches]
MEMAKRPRTGVNMAQRGKSLQEVRENAKRRKQEQRAREKAEKDHLQRQVTELQRQIHELLKTKVDRDKIHLTALPVRIKHAVLSNRRLIAEVQSLKDRCQQLYAVMAILSPWVYGLNIFEGTPHMTARALPSHPESRKYCHKWLCDKVYHMALAAYPEKPSPCRLQDQMITTIHLGEDNLGTSLEAIQLRSQYVVTADYRDVAAVLWDLYISSSQQHTVQIIDKVHDEMVYFSVDYGAVKSKLLNLAGVYRDDRRIVITLTTIAYDDRFPLMHDASRMHGFGWMILDDFGQGMTLCRQSCLQYTPVNNEGPLSLEEMGELMHYDLKANEPRENVITKFQDVVEDGYSMQRDVQIRAHFPL